ncbi:MAG: 5'-nucleotidase [Bacteroidetes bacterium HLUCCA01]|nr:MAG: 5'-nucleotidase [Bacteroidetes bacterium HLUCCA01]
MSAAGLGLGLTSVTPLLSYAGNGTRQLTILHTNDTHARIDPFPENASRYAGLGGVARRASLVGRIRAENPNVLLLDAGDVFQGTPYFNYYKGALDFKVMSQMGYDASTPGNHEFDNGIDGFVEVAGEAEFPFVNANYDFGTSPMADYVKENIVRDVDGIKVGIFGLGINFDGLVLPALHEGVAYRHPVRLAQYQANRLRYDYKCDLVVCLSHLGYNYENPARVDDVTVATQTRGIDLIIGGHTHTFMDAPERIRKDDGSVTIISQVGFAGIVLGRIDFEFNRRREVVRATAANHTVS